MATVVVPQLVDGQALAAADLNTIVSAVLAELNGNIDHDNLAYARGSNIVGFLVDSTQYGFNTASGGQSYGNGAVYFHNAAQLLAARYALFETVPGAFSASSAILRMYFDSTAPSISAGSVVLATATVVLTGVAVHKVGAMTISQASIPGSGWVFFNLENPAGISGTDWTIRYATATIHAPSLLVE